MLNLLSKECKVRHGVLQDWSDRLLCCGSGHIKNCPKKRRKYCFNWECLIFEESG